MSPGSIRICSPAPRTSSASATVGTAWAFVHRTRSLLLRVRLMSPYVATAPPAATSATMPTSRSRRRLGVLTGCEGIIAISSGWGWASRHRLRQLLYSFAVTRVDEAEHCRHEEQRRASGEEQSTDHRATERRVLAGFDRHRHHADDHRERGHQHGPEPGTTGLEGRGQRVRAGRQPFAGEADYQNAVRRSDAHAHDGPRERWDGERSAGSEEDPNDARKRSRQRGNDHERIEPRLKVHDDKKINQDDGEGEADEELLIGAGHRRHLAAQHYAGTVRHVAGRILHHLANVSGHGAEIAV